MDIAALSMGMSQIQVAQQAGLSVMKMAMETGTEQMTDMMAMVEAGLDLSPVLTHRYHYTEFEEAFAVMNSGQSGKVVLDWTEVRA